MKPRALAVKILQQVIVERHALDEQLSRHLRVYPEPQQLPFIKALCFGVVRHYHALDRYYQHLIAKPLTKKHSDLYTLILIGLYQLLYMDVPAYAAISETVSTASYLKKAWAQGLINAVLRNFQSQRAQIQDQYKHELTVKYLHPAWMIKQLSTAWPKQWKNILQANNAHPPMSLRVNEQRCQRDSYLNRLNVQGMPATASKIVSSGIILHTPMTVANLPGFNEGDVSIQDLAAQLAAYLLDLKPGMRVLDACSAPGGKTCHILELEPGLSELVAVEKHVERLAKVSENLQRLNLDAHLIHADLTETNKWWDKKKFDRILLDVPCSASGVIRRHPDIKLLRRPEDIPKLVETQVQLLTSLWPLLKVGGMLVYCTCSVFPSENNELIHTFVQQHPNALLNPIKGQCGQKLDYGNQILPGWYDMDGFYYARLLKSN